MEVKFTPGPWSVEDDKRAQIVSPSGYVLIPSEMPEWLTVNEEILANAHLVSAAPELFAACKAALHELSQPKDRRMDVAALHGNLLPQLRVAISKALGAL